MWIYRAAHYLELAFSLVHLGLLKEMQSGCICEMRYFGFAPCSVTGLFAVDVCGSSRRLCCRVVCAFVGYAHYGESPCPCLVVLTASACGCSCVCDLVRVRVRYLVSQTASDVSVDFACVLSRAQTRLHWGRVPASCFSNWYPRLSNVAVNDPYLWRSLYPTRLSHSHPAPCASSTALPRQPLPHVLSSLSAPAPLVPFLSLELRAPVHAV